MTFNMYTFCCWFVVLCYGLVWYRHRKILYIDIYVILMYVYFHLYCMYMFGLLLLLFHRNFSSMNKKKRMYLLSFEMFQNKFFCRRCKKVFCFECVITLSCVC